MMSRMDEVFKKVLNDRDIFRVKRKIFNESEWTRLKEEKEMDARIKMINEKIESFKRELEKDNEQQDLKSCIYLCETLKEELYSRPNIVKQRFSLLKEFGLVECNLPNMDDYGKIIERHSMPIIEQFFLDKIKRENNKHRKKALARVFEYVKELYNANASPLEIAFFVRKLDSLKTFWEV